MQVSEIQRRHRTSLEAQPVPRRRVLAWLLVGALIVAGIVLFFRYAHTLTPLLDT